MVHSTQVPYPVWCSKCQITTERTTMISGDTVSPRPLVVLIHDSCGETLATIEVKELVSLPSLQRMDVAQELVRRANTYRPARTQADIVRDIRIATKQYGETLVQLATELEQLG